MVLLSGYKNFQPPSVPDFYETKFSQVSSLLHYYYHLPGHLPPLTFLPSSNSNQVGTKSPLIFSQAALVAQTVKNLPTMRETWVRSLGCKDLLEEGMATHSSVFWFFGFFFFFFALVFLTGEFHGQRSLAGHNLWDHKKSDMIEWLSISPMFSKSKSYTLVHKSMVPGPRRDPSFQPQPSSWGTHPILSGEPIHRVHPYTAPQVPTNSKTETCPESLALPLAISM